MGSLEVICGCMFSGKTERLLDRISEARACGIEIAVFKHAADHRYLPDHVVSHRGRKAAATVVKRGREILKLAGEAQLIVVDEGQFFDADLLGTCKELIRQGRDVVVAGLDLDCWALPFGPMSSLEVIANRVTRMEAVCACCGRVAEYTQRIVPVSSDDMIGGEEAYEPRCAKCYRSPSPKFQH